MGVVVAAGDSSALAAGIRDVLDHPHRYQRSRADVLAEFDIDRTVRDYERLFAELMRPVAAAG
jgi:hypothetical protein